MQKLHKQFLLYITGFALYLQPLQLYAGEDFQCGDWMCSIYGVARTWTKKSSHDIEFTYNIELERNQNNTLIKQHYISPSIKPLTGEQSVIFNFDNSVSIIVPITDINDSNIKFSNLNSIASLEQRLMEGTSFSIQFGKTELVGPFSLIGSKKALSLLDTSKYPNLELLN